MSAALAQHQTVVVLGIPFHDVTFAEAVEWAKNRIASRRPAYIATANVDFLTQASRDPELQRILLEADLVVADGSPIVKLSGHVGPALRERVTGSDLVPMLSEMAAANGYSVFFLGGAPGVPEKAAAELTRRYPGLRVAGCYSPPKADILTMNHADILARLEETKPDLLFVAFGAPKQEKFANMHVRRWSVSVSMGVGGSLDFLAGAQKRAPGWMQKVSMEWLWRMFSDPRRLFRRYAANMVFLTRAVSQMNSLRKEPNKAAVIVDDPRGMMELRVVAHVEKFTPLPDGQAAAELQERLIKASGSHAVALDLSGVDWLNSLELGALVRLTSQLRSQRRALVLFHAGSRVAKLIDAMRLNAYLNVAGSVREVVQTIRSIVATDSVVQVKMDPAGVATLILPMELTAVNAAGLDEVFTKTPALDGMKEWHVNAEAMRFADSTGIGALVRLKKRALDAGIGVRFEGWQPSVMKTLKIARVDSLFAPGK